MSSLNQMIGKEVFIYPEHRCKKKGIVKDITDAGVLFLITESHKYSTTYIVGALHFISFSDKLTFREVLNDEK
tara:strand:+ start:58 stop:276 length:219 start_codon:yes stop_codon:yes gene_type:complete